MELSEQSTPRLLVSVRSLAEAWSAIEGGCEILDIKEPDRGSLGMADTVISHEIIDALRNKCPQLTLSAALGEVSDWTLDSQGLQNKFGQSVPQGCDFLKIGCAGLGSGSEWKTLLQGTRQALAAQLGKTIRWVAVAYADCELANAPCVEDLVQSALSDNCCGMLIDTWSKTGKGLLDWIDVKRMKSIAEDVHGHGMFLALAGSLRGSAVAELMPVGADVFAIRGAACHSGDRRAVVSAEAVRRFKQRLEVTNLADSRETGTGVTLQ